MEATRKVITNVDDKDKLIKLLVSQDVRPSQFCASKDISFHSDEQVFRDDLENDKQKLGKILGLDREQLNTILPVLLESKNEQVRLMAESVELLNNPSDISNLYKKHPLGINVEKKVIDDLRADKCNDKQVKEKPDIEASLQNDLPVVAQKKGQSTALS